MSNPHKLFTILTLTATGFLIVGLAASGDIEPVYEMVKVFGVGIVIIGIVLAVTRRYWRDARRLA